MSTLERAIAIAAEAHAGQVDKAGAPYILHPLRVMLSLHSIEEQIAGVLHDLVEDCPEWTFDRLRHEGFSEPIIAALEAVTKREGEHGDANYTTFVRRARGNKIGRQVKLADLLDNMDLSRLASPTETDLARVRKYAMARDVLLEGLSPNACELS